MGKNKVKGLLPDFGAIFMSNRATMEECLERKLFGLPSFNAGFVKQIKAGMILFLFEYEKRQLHGVFRADSDGGMNIVPHAYASSGKQFPAQVRITPIWHCNPLGESEFCDAIRENYYATKKFHFGLSQDQVSRLLRLFNSKRIEVGTLRKLSRVRKRQQRSPSGNREMENDNSRFRRKLSSGKVVTYKQPESSSSNHFDTPEVCGSQSLLPSRFSQSPPGRHEPNADNSVSEKQPITTVEEEEKSPCRHESGADNSVSEKQHIIIVDKEERFKDTHRDLSTEPEDFIPLPSPESSDSEDQSVGNSIIDTAAFGSCVEPCLPMIPAALTRENLGQENINGHFAVSFPPSSTGNDCLNKVTQKQNVSDKVGDELPVKGLYSDVHGDRSSAFSRLNLGSKGSRQGKSRLIMTSKVTDQMKNEKMSAPECTGPGKEGKPYRKDTVEDIMEELLLRHGKWGNSTRQDNAEPLAEEKTSVFSRLAWASKSVREDAAVSTKLQLRYDEQNKRTGKFKFDVEVNTCNHKMSQSVVELPETWQQHDHWEKMEETEVSFQKRGYEEKSTQLDKMLKRKDQTEGGDRMDDSRSKSKDENRLRRKLVRPSFVNSSELKKMTSAESSVSEGNGGSYQSTMIRDRAEDTIDASLGVGVQLVRDNGENKINTSLGVGVQLVRDNGENKINTSLGVGVQLVTDNGETKIDTSVEVGGVQLVTDNGETKKDTSLGVGGAQLVTENGETDCNLFDKVSKLGELPSGGWKTPILVYKRRRGKRSSLTV